MLCGSTRLSLRTVDWWLRSIGRHEIRPSKCTLPNQLKVVILILTSETMCAEARWQNQNALVYPVLSTKLV